MIVYISKSNDFFLKNLINHQTLIPTRWMKMLFYFFLLLHSVSLSLLKDCWRMISYLQHCHWSRKQQNKIFNFQTEASWTFSYKYGNIGQFSSVSCWISQPFGENKLKLFFVKTVKEFLYFNCCVKGRFSFVEREKPEKL